MEIACIPQSTLFCSRAEEMYRIEMGKSLHTVFHVDMLFKQSTYPLGDS